MESKLRTIITDFFTKEGFIYREYHPGSDGSDCCENAATAYTFKSHDGTVHFLPQTRQLRMEYDIRSGLYDKVWTWDWSHRNEDRYGDGRHDRFFPLVEFECTDSSLHKLFGIERKLLDTVASYFVARPLKHTRLSYSEAIAMVDAQWGDDISQAHENSLLEKTKTDVLYIYSYPEELCHFTMAEEFSSGNKACMKVDVILPAGGETIGSAVRSTNPEYLHKRLYESDMFKGLVELGMSPKAFEPYFQLNLTTPAMGGGIGVNRLQRWVLQHLLK